LSENKLFFEWLAELKSVLNFFETWKESTWENLNYVIDLQIIRGLDYYSGTVFEAMLKNDEWLGSICGGWRYEHLIWYLNPKKDIYAGFGGSIWISRLLSKIFGENNEKVEQKTSTEYLFLNFEETKNQILKLMNKFQKEWKNCELYYQADKLGKQFGYADKKWIPYVVILWEWERSDWIYKVKNMQTGEEESVKL
jgi:histidyl-tRNA synthetase